MKNLGGSPRKIFIGDGNPLALPAERLLSVLALIREYFPNCREIMMDATVTNIAEKSDSELAALREGGLCELFLGIESGLEDVLEFMKKDHTVAEARLQIERIKKAGLIYSAHIMCGTAGRGRGMENAESTARFLNETRPRKVINTSLFIEEGAPLLRDIASGAFTPASELENLLEERRLIELIDVPVEKYDGLHDYIEARVKGRLPEDRGKMLARLAQCALRVIEDDIFPQRVADILKKSGSKPVLAAAS